VDQRRFCGYGWRFVDCAQRAFDRAAPLRPMWDRSLHQSLSPAEGAGTHHADAGSPEFSADETTFTSQAAGACEPRAAHRHLWRSMPSRWTLVATVITVAVVSTMAMLGILMAPVAPLVVIKLLICVGLFTLVLDVAKVQILMRA